MQGQISCHHLNIGKGFWLNPTSFYAKSPEGTRSRRMYLNKIWQPSCYIWQIYRQYHCENPSILLKSEIKQGGMLSLTFKNKDLFFFKFWNLSRSVFISVCGSAHEHSCPRKPEEGVGFPWSHKCGELPCGAGNKKCYLKKPVSASSEPSLQYPDFANLTQCSA